jgi:ABC-type dipeptide/oligopeptide/nickel transport system ATPase component
MMMNQKVPKHISNFFLYRKWSRDIRVHEKCLGLIVVGKTGSGKSWLALRIAADLDPTFDAATRVVYTAEDFMRLVAYGKLKRGQAIIFDELAHAEGGDSRASMSRTNRLLSGIVSTYRQMGLIVIFVLPTLTQLDKNLRMISIDGYFEIISIDHKNKETICSFKQNDLNVIMGKSYSKLPIVTLEDGSVKKVKAFRFPAPPMNLVKVYR